MENKVALTPAIPEPSTPAPVNPFTAPANAAGGASVSAPKEPVAQDKPEASAGPQPYDLRLVIEQDSETGTFVYKTVDRRTGDVLQQFPQEDVLRFKQAEHYDPGEIFDGLT